MTMPKTSMQKTVVRIRFARYGQRNKPFYRIVAIDRRWSNLSWPLEFLGTYDPFLDRDEGKSLRLNVERVKYWIAQGAHPSDSMARLLGKFGILPERPRRISAYDRKVDHKLLSFAPEGYVLPPKEIKNKKWLKPTGEEVLRARQTNASGLKHFGIQFHHVKFGGEKMPVDAEGNPIEAADDESYDPNALEMEVDEDLKAAIEGDDDTIDGEELDKGESGENEK